MANGKSRVILNPIYVGGMCVTPADTAGVRGNLDSGDPTRLTLFGNTPGILGVYDAADPTVLSRNLCSVGRIGANHWFDKEFLVCGPPETGLASSSLITLAALKAADPSNDDAYYNSILLAMQSGAAAYAVDTKLRVAHFLSQIGHESSFRAVSENGVYTAPRMKEIFGCRGGSKNFDKITGDCRLDPATEQPMRLRDKLWSDEQSYAGNASNLLSYAYASRLGNGDEASGEGYKYRGRGMVQLTGKINYQKFTDSHNARLSADRQDFVVNPDLLISNITYAVESAFYFWDSAKVAAVADKDDVEAVTLKINGGTNGLEDRRARVNRVKAVLGLT